MPTNNKPGNEGRKTASCKRRWLGYVLAAAVTAFAVFLLYRTLSRYEWPELVDAVTSVSSGRLLVALAFTALSYLTLTGFDWLALRYVGRPLSYRQAAIASFTSLSIGHTLGFAALSSGTIRYRYYSRWGLRGSEVAQLIVFCGMTVGLGLAILGGIALLIAPVLVIEALGLDRAIVNLVAAAAIAFPVVYLAMSAFFGRTINIRGREVRMPPLKLALAQIVIGPLNFAFVAAALHQAVLSFADIDYLPVASAYVSANVATLVTHVPGGLGVIEAVLAYLLPGTGVIGAVLIFRFVYFLIPLCLGLVTLGFSELILARADNRPASRDQTA
ncbi:lysylphosphatidylglycerol synthase domain-containing protein [Roseovarius sp. B08]|uniref:lysylphosphatidylglycerol synthase domain-containing protein n=1 Tax=Roseovarius sp. B08 TaxID=3449223 RepID=UPI003EDBE69C